MDTDKKIRDALTMGVLVLVGWALMEHGLRMGAEVPAWMPASARVLAVAVAVAMVVTIWRETICRGR